MRVLCDMTGVDRWFEYNSGEIIPTEELILVSFQDVMRRCDA